MMRILFKCLLLSLLILNAEVKKAEAFFLMPPMPWSIEVDIPGNAGKIVSVAQSAFRQYQEIKSQLSAGQLAALKKCYNFDPNMGGKGKAAEGNIVKSPGKGEFANNSDLGLTKNGLDEEENFNAYYKLFLVYPPKDTVPEDKGGFSLLKSAYQRKRVEYQQDAVIDAYVIGNVTEKFLDFLDTEIERLDNCQKGIYTESEMQKNCSFFGLQMAYIDPHQKEPTDDPAGSDDPGQYGETLNAYIVTVVQDRFLRIIEDLTAAEALFRAAIQLDYADPISPEDKQSSAEDYQDNGFRFAYNDSHEYISAKILANYNRSNSCKAGGKNCAASNKEATAIKNMDDATILKDIQKIADDINQAVQFHNKKANIGDYKTQYRKYLKAVDIHKRAYEALSDNEYCLEGFMRKHKPVNVHSVEEVLYGKEYYQLDDYRKNKSNYDLLGKDGIIYKLISEYQNYTTDTLIGTNAKCNGYYETCPDGYVEDKDEDGNVKVCPEDNAMKSCVVPMIANDTEQGDFDGKTVKVPDMRATQTQKIDDTDGLVDGTQAEKLDLDNRVKAEKSWRIGSKMMTDLTKKGTLKFNMWNDQKNLHVEYLRNKYRNIKMIIRTMDKGYEAVKVAYRLSKAEFNPDVNIDNGAENILKEILSCKTPNEAKQEAEDKYCTEGYPSYEKGYDGKYYRNTELLTHKTTASGTPYSAPRGTMKVYCYAEANTEEGFIHVYREKVEDPYASNVKVLKEEYKKVDQRIGNCEYKKTVDKNFMQNLTSSGNNSCPSVWDFKISTLIETYFPKILAEKCSAAPVYVHVADAVYKRAYNAGRIVAKNKLEDVLKARKQKETSLKNLAETYNTKIEKFKTDRENAIKAMTSSNNAIDQATTDKNKLVRERQRTENRIASIDAEIAELEQRVKALEGMINDDDPITKENIEKEIASIKNGAGEDLSKIKNPTRANEIGRIPALEEERAYLKDGKGVGLLIYKGLCETSSSCDQDCYDKCVQEKFFRDLPSLIYIINERNNTINEKKQTIDALKKTVKELDEKITKTSEEFAEKYLEEEEKEEKKVKEANDKFETMVNLDSKGNKPKRMENTKKTHCCCSTIPVIGCPCSQCNNEYEEDNLETTMRKILFEDKALNKIIRPQLEKTWFSNEARSAFVNKIAELGIPQVMNFAVEIGGIPAGKVAITDIINKVKDVSLDIASTKLEEKIKQADEAVQSFMDYGIAKVDEVIKTFGISGEKDAVPDPRIFEPQNYSGGRESMQHKCGYYTSGGCPWVTKVHRDMVESLVSPCSSSEECGDGPKMDIYLAYHSDVVRSKIFGFNQCSVDDCGYGNGWAVFGRNGVMDDEYFVGLPARGAGSKFDANDGRDYHAPKAPLSNIPPLREVFYFDAADYQDVAQSRTIPSFVQLLDKKFKGTEYEEEYLPEVWRYILAKPNLRQDGKYHQTFIERSFDGDMLKTLMQGEDKNYYTLFARGGVYPCGESILGYIDVKAGRAIGNVAFAKNKVNETKVVCKEIKYFKGGIEHLLADHTNNKDDYAQTSLDTVTSTLYNDYSELGQFLQKDLKYRPLVRSIYERLTDEKSTQKDGNNITRRKAETAAFTRNLFGSFLDVVNAEHSAKKLKDNSTEDIKKSISDLCGYIVEQGQTVYAAGDNSKSDALIGDCQDDANCVCEALVMETTKNGGLGGLAKSADDKAYDVDCGETSDATFYEKIYCQLDEWKNEKLDKAKSDLVKLKRKYSDSKLYPNAIKNAQERITEVENYIAALELDKDELTTIQPGADKTSTNEALKTAKADRDAVRASDEEALKAMDNQSRVAPYCPVY